jgi:hypothetical protein
VPLTGLLSLLWLAQLNAGLWAERFIVPAPMIWCLVYVRQRFVHRCHAPLRFRATPLLEVAPPKVDLRFKARRWPTPASQKDPYPVPDRPFLI